MHPFDAYMVKQAELKPDVTFNAHQNDAIERIKANGSHIIAHGVGTGKTGTSIGAFEALKKANPKSRALVIVPAQLRENFANEGVRKFTNSKFVKYGPKHEEGAHHLDYGKPPDADYHIVSNEMFRKNPMAYLKASGADTIIWDEAHKGRNDQSLNYAAMKAVRPHVKNFVALTGTPIMNHPRDVVPLIDLVSHGKHRLGHAGDSKALFAKTDPRDSFDSKFIKDVTTTHGPMARFGIGDKITEPRIVNHKALASELNKHIHYVPVDDVAGDMPKKVVHNVDVEMSMHQKSLYDYTMRNVNPITAHKIRNNIPVGKSEAGSIFNKIMQNRQVSNSVHTLDRRYDPTAAAKHTPKTNKLLNDLDAHLKADPKNKAIVYSNLVHGGVDALSAGLKARGHNHGMFIGSTHQDKAERNQHVKDYLSGKRRVMLVNSAGLEGLNLPGTTAHYALDGHFNPAAIEQSEARGIRAGSTAKEVHVYRYKSVMPRVMGFRMPGNTSVDEWVYNVAERKSRLNNQLLGLLDRKDYKKEPKK